MQLIVEIVEAKVASTGLLKRPPNLFAQLKWVGNGGQEAKEEKTGVVVQTLTPKWKDNRFQFPVEEDDDGAGGRLEVELIDHLTLSTAGTASLTLKKLLQEQDGSGKSSCWFNLDHEGRATGKLHLICSMVWDDEVDGQSDSEAGDESPMRQREQSTGISAEDRRGSANCRTRYRIGDVVGKGAFGRVFMGMNVATGELLAVKQIEISRLTPVELAALEQELRVLRELRHTHIVSYIDTDVREDALNILMEFCPGGSVAKLLRVFGAFEEDTIRAYARQILEGLAFLHANKVVHRDIKGANILVSHNCLKIGDFGASTRLIGASTMVEDRGVPGTPYWMAPEVILQQNYGRKADVWSVGMTVLEMATGHHPWQARDNKFSIMYEIAHGTELPEIPATLSPPCREFILQCLQRNPSDRPASVDLLAHPFLSQSAAA